MTAQGFFGLMKNKIKSLRENFFFLKLSCNSIIKNTGRRKILFVLHELSNTGAPLVILPLIKAIAEREFEVMVLAPHEGQLKQNIEKCNIPVFIVPAVLHPSEQFIKHFLSKFDLVFINTIALYEMIDVVNRIEQLTLLWVHESYYGLSAFKQVLPKALNNSIHVFAVSNYAIEAMHKLLPQWQAVELLAWGIKDEKLKVTISAHTDRIRFLCIGSIEKRKGQDILIEAMSFFTAEERSRITVNIVGNPPDMEFFEELCKNAAPFRINIQPGVSHEDALRLLCESSAVIIPSRDESVSMVAVESLMLGIPVIVSDTCGITDVLTSGKNAMIFESGSATSLHSILRAIKEESIDLNRIRHEGRKTYEEFFSFDKYLSRAIKVLSELTG